MTSLTTRETLVDGFYCELAGNNGTCSKKFARTGDWQGQIRTWANKGKSSYTELRMYKTKALGTCITFSSTPSKVIKL